MALRRARPSLARYTCTEVYSDSPRSRLEQYGVARALHIEQWQLEIVGLGYQLGTLVLPTVVPIAIWLVLDRAFAGQLVRPAV